MDAAEDVRTFQAIRGPVARGGAATRTIRLSVPVAPPASPHAPDIEEAERDRRDRVVAAARLLIAALGPGSLPTAGTGYYRTLEQLQVLLRREIDPLRG